MSKTEHASPARRGRLGASSLLLILVTGFALAFASAPWFAFRALRSAAQNGDGPALAELIDYNAVRAALRGQITPQPQAQLPPADIWHDPIGAVRRALQAPLQAAQVDVDAYLTPVALARLTSGRPALTVSPAAARPPFPAIIYWDVRRCRIAVRDPETPARRTVFTWRRDGLFEWKLVQIGLPSSPNAG